AGTVHFTSSDGSATLPSDYPFDGNTPSHTFIGGVTLFHGVTQSITATDTSNSSITGSANVTVNGAAATHLDVTGYPTPTTAGASHSFTVTALDPPANPATGYAGTVHFTSSDAQAVLPADSTLTNGTGSFDATLKTAGTQSITGTDTNTSSITGSQTGIVVNPASASVLTVAGYPSPTTAGTANNFTVTANASL